VFQSLGRDSVCSYQEEARGAARRRPRFNPSVGILFVHTRMGARAARCGFEFQSLGRDSVCSYPPDLRVETTGGRVSIPRSGFCLFIPGQEESVEDLPEKFQSLGRDSVCSYVTMGWMDRPALLFQSLGRDSVCSYTTCCRWVSTGVPSFNPSVGILFVHTSHILRMWWPFGCFNPSVGILFVHTVFHLETKTTKRLFQSLGRDSVCSY